MGKRIMVLANTGDEFGPFWTEHEAQAWADKIVRESSDCTSAVVTIEDES